AFEPGPLELLLEEPAAVPGGLPALLADPVADAAARRVRDAELHPVRARRLLRRGQDLDLVTGGEVCRERTARPAHRRPDAVDAALGVELEGEVDGRGAAREREEVALRGEDVDLLVVEVELELLDELAGAVRRGVLEEVADPGVDLLHRLVRADLRGGAVA